jgi:hypothetical protein
MVGLYDDAASQAAGGQSLVCDGDRVQRLGSGDAWRESACVDECREFAEARTVAADPDVVNASAAERERCGARCHGYKRAAVANRVKC